jgi:hypothetical protein
MDVYKRACGGLVAIDAPPVADCQRHAQAVKVRCNPVQPAAQNASLWVSGWLRAGTQLH